MNYLLLLILSLFGTLLYGQKVESTMKFESKVYDFGEINELDGVVSHTFYFTNSGDKPFVIENITVSCGCTSPVFSKEPILSNKRGSITVNFNPKDRPGLFVNDIVVTSNNRKNQDKLVIKGDVIGRPKLIEEEYPFSIGNSGLRVSEQSKSVGYIEQGSVISTAIPYVNTTNKSIEVVVKSHLRDIKNATSTRYIIETKSRGEFTVSIDLRDRRMLGMQDLIVEYTVDDISQRFKTLISAIGTPNFKDVDMTRAPIAKFSSTFKSFGDVKSGALLRHKVTLRNDGKGDLIISYIQLAKGLTCTLSNDEVIKPGESVEFEVKLDTSRYNEGRVFANAYITLNDPKRPFREIRTVAYLK